ncbi:rhodanese-like domain-containing protein [Pseudanabaena sp. FACHB-2040]|uniref:rhodanese-like domain-containing protein n=1 Tax=Pseudanabaena sp. FACHB-2040 TaxID=2692859 RepID=UPI00168716AA|nr:rhodanese-like domain-containing protein [Pseudanabaena sp. FACHB-2040]MBD2256017.1 rhodanese-like domain-containing protein [Pseudanabaena sp. FACHB-2040]
MSNETSEQLNKVVSDQVVGAKKAITAPLPHPPSFSPQASPREMKKRLDWGEPALTIIDIRDRETFGKEHIKGAMCMPADEQFVETISASLEHERDIYLYGNSDEETAQAANMLRQAGFTRIAELQGNLDAWKTINGTVEGYNA